MDEARGMEEGWTREPVAARLHRLTAIDVWGMAEVQEVLDILDVVRRDNDERWRKIDEHERQLEELGAMQEHQAAMISSLLEENDLLRAKLLLVTREDKDGLG